MNNYLQHWGIQGMKWGVRRWQNEDGTLTEEGKQRYAKYDRKISKQQSKVAKLQNKRDKMYQTVNVKAAKHLTAAGKHQRKANALIHPLQKYHNWRYERNMGKYRNEKGKIDKINAEIISANTLIKKYNTKLDNLSPERVSKGAEYIKKKYGI